MNIQQHEFNKRLHDISDVAIASQERLSQLAEFIDTLNTNIRTLMERDLQFDVIGDKGLQRINDDLDHIAMLQDTIKDDLELLKPVVNNLSDQTFWLKNNIYWFTEIKPDPTLAKRK